MRGTQLPQRGVSQALLGRHSDTTALAWNVAKNRFIARMIVPPALWWNTPTQLLLCLNVHHHALKAQASSVLWVDVRRQDHVNIPIPLTWPNIPSYNSCIFSHAMWEQLGPLWESLQAMDRWFNLSDHKLLFQKHGWVRKNSLERGLQGVGRLIRWDLICRLLCPHFQRKDV